MWTAHESDLESKFIAVVLKKSFEGSNLVVHIDVDESSQIVKFDITSELDSRVHAALEQEHCWVTFQLELARVFLMDISI